MPREYIRGRTHKEYLEDNRERIAEYRRAYYRLHREKFLEKSKAYQIAHREECNRRRRCRYYRSKGWSEEDIERLIAK